MMLGRKMTNEIIIKPFSPDLSDDYLNFFDNDAFADNPDWAGCYCNYYHFDHKNCKWNDNTAKHNRDAIFKRIKDNNYI